MARFNFSEVGKTASTRGSVAWGKKNTLKNNLEKTGGALLFGALLIVCAIAVGCSSEPSKPATSTIQTPAAQNTTAMAMPSSVPAPPTEATAKPAVKKIVHRRPANLTYADKTSGVSFQYPRKYDLKTGEDAGKLVSSIPLPMNFVQPGGVALAAVELPESIYNGNDLAAAFFNVSVNKSVTAEQCGQFAAPQPETVKPAESPAPADASVQTGQSVPATPTVAPAQAEPVPTAAQTSKLILGDMELQGTEAVTGEGIRQSDAKYFHVFQNGACYEFAVNVTTAAPDSQLALKHVDREKAFQQLEKILATVKVETVAAPEVAATAATTPTTGATPAQ
jgi:hypothetical protein